MSKHTDQVERRLMHAEMEIESLRPSVSQDINNIRTAHELVEEMRQAGSHYWNKDTMRFFRSRGPFQVTPCALGVLFCTSERFEAADRSRARKWSVRLWTGETVLDVGKFNAYSRHQALRLLARAKQFRSASELDLLTDKEGAPRA